MMKKLFKYEFRSMGRTLIPIYIAVAAISVIMSITIALNLNELPEALYSSFAYQMQGIFTMVITLVYFAIIVALFVVTFSIILQRFYKGLLCDEGYLMFTLPVKTWQLITSKGVTAFVMSILSGIVACISIFILMLGAVNFMDLNNLMYVFKELNMYFPKWGLYVFEFAVIIIVSGFASIYQVYASMAIGHLAKKNRMLMSVVAYVVISAIINWAAGIGAVILGFFGDDILYGATNEALLQMIINSAVVMEILCFIVFFVITERILSKKLNLE